MNKSIMVIKIILISLVWLSGLLKAAEPDISAIRGSLEPEDDHAYVRHTIQAQLGDYIEGVLETEEMKVTLRIVDSDSARPVRLLVDDVKGSNDFRFVANTDNPVLEIMTDDQSGSYSLSITRKIPERQQMPPERIFLSEIINDIARHLRSGGDTNDFWAMASVRGTPLVEEGDNGMAIMTFLYRGASNNVRIMGAPSNDIEELERLGVSDVWFKSFTVPWTSRLSYQLAPDVPEFDGTPRERRVAILATLQKDPLNHFPWPDNAEDEFSQSSTITLSSAPPLPGIKGVAELQGSLERFLFSSQTLNNNREILIYQPPGFTVQNPDNVLLFVFDARQYTEEVATPEIIERLIIDGLLPPVTAVFIANAGAQARRTELPPNSSFATMLADELLPEVLSRTGLEINSDKIILAGSSYGGLASISIAMRYPQKFGNVLSMSGSFWWPANDPLGDAGLYVSEEVIRLEKLPLKIFLGAGIFETTREGNIGILESNRNVRDVLRARAYDITYQEYAVGHDLYAWQGMLADGLLSLFGP